MRFRISFFVSSMLDTSAFAITLFAGTGSSSWTAFWICTTMKMERGSEMVGFMLKTSWKRMVRSPAAQS